MKNEILRFIVLIFVILYVVSPLDVCPGSIDDIIALIMSYVVRKDLKA